MRIFSDGNWLITMHRTSTNSPMNVCAIETERYLGAAIESPTARVPTTTITNSMGVETSLRCCPFARPVTDLHGRKRELAISNTAAAIPTISSDLVNHSGGGRSRDFMGGLALV
jgi:hypothetical protein